MAIDPGVLQAIGNPSGGQFSRLGDIYAKQKQQNLENQPLHRKDAIAGAKVANSYAKTAKKWHDDYTDSETGEKRIPTEEEFTAYQSNLRDQYNPAFKKFINKNFQPIDTIYNSISRTDGLLRAFEPENYKEKDAESIFSKADVSKFTPQSIAKAEESGNRSDLRLRPDKKGSSPVGTSEFERVLNASLKAGKITAERYDALMLQRTEGLAGEMTVKDTTKLNSKERKERIEDSDALRDEYGEGSKHFSDINENIDAAMAALDSGDTTVADQLLNKILTQTGDTDIRAVQMYNIMDSSSGDIWDRFTGDVGKYLGGSRTEFQKQQIRTTLEAFRDQYSKPRSDNVKNRYRFLAKEKGLDPFVVVPAKNPLEIKTSPFTSHMTPREKLQLIRRQFPTWRPQ